jgi:hypothetical protein
MGFCLSGLFQLAARAINEDAFRVRVQGRPVVQEAKGPSDLIGAEVPHLDVGVTDQRRPACLCVPITYILFVFGNVCLLDYILLRPRRHAFLPNRVTYFM